MANSWRATDNGIWWLRSAAFNETGGPYPGPQPTGDYDANCFLSPWPAGSTTYVDSAADIHFNDWNCLYNSSNKYICSTNDFNNIKIAG